VAEKPLAIVDEVHTRDAYIDFVAYTDFVALYTILEALRGGRLPQRSCKRPIGAVRGRPRPIKAEEAF
jgi:hypothetical protein